ncbi:MAG TPA: ECF transporter S component [Bacillota bacterium]|nr:ECF transporter S component [Bacillota bacterium]
MHRINIRKLVGIALFTAIVIVLQLLGSFIKFGTFSISLVLIPIVVGAAVYGWRTGAWLGFVFGAAVLLSGDATLFFNINPIGTVVTVLLKGTLAGFASGLVYKMLEGKNKYLAVFTAAVVCPVVNTGVFLLGSSVFFLDTITEWAQAAGFEGALGSYMIIGLVGLNFVFELVFNLVLSPAAVTLIKIGQKRTQE